MSTTVLYHGIGLHGNRYVRQEHRKGPVIFHIEQPRERLRCPHCRSGNVWAQGSVARIFHMVPIGSKPVQLQFAVPRVLCHDCRQVRQVKLDFAAPKKHFTRIFRSYVLDLSQHKTIQAVARRLTNLRNR